MIEEERDLSEVEELGYKTRPLPQTLPIPQAKTPSSRPLQDPQLKTLVSNGKKTLVLKEVNT